MRTVWRITTERFAASAFDGEGARLYGGRWNPKGVPVVYTADSQSLALLEMLVQDEPLRARYVLIPVHLAADLGTERIELDQLPTDWRTPAARPVLQRIGRDWLERGESALLDVPSAVVPAERNVLLNPHHPAFSRILIGQAVPLETDSRLLRPSRPGR